MKISENLAKMGIVLPQPSAPVALYAPVKQGGNILYVSGQLPSKDGQVQFTGKLTKDSSLEEGQQAARLCAINALAAISAHLNGDLDKIKDILKVNVFVNSSENFTDQPQVANGASQFLADALGERGKHARTAVGVAQLPKDATVEIDIIVEIY